MKRGIIIASIALGSVFLISCIAVILILSFSGWKGAESQMINETHAAAIENDGRLIVDSGMADCTISYAQDDTQEVTATLTGNGARHRFNFTVEQTADGVKVTAKRPFTLFNFQLFGNYNLTVTVPRSFAGDLELNNSAGGTQVNLTKLGEVTLKSGAGALMVGNLEAESLYMNNSAGKIAVGTIVVKQDIEFKNSAGSTEAQSLTAGGEVAISSSAGTIQVNALQAVTANIKNSAGRTELYHVADTDVTAHQSAGEIICEYAVFSNNQVDIKNSASRIRLSLPENAAFALDASTSAGKVECAFPVLSTEHSNDRIRGTVNKEGAQNLVKLHSSAGSVIIEQMAVNE